MSSFGNDFNFDYQVSATPEEKAKGMAHYNYADTEFPSDERPGTSVFFKDPAGEIFHTYSSYGRGLDILIGAYNFLELAPKGRDEAGLSYGMAWVRHHDKYEAGAKPRETHFADRAVYDYSARAWLNLFLQRWLASDGSKVRTAIGSATVADLRT